MCQLLGMNSYLPASLTLSFTGFSQRGCLTTIPMAGHRLL